MAGGAWLRIVELGVKNARYNPFFPYEPISYQIYMRRPPLSCTPLLGTKAVVTGSSGGIGRAIALELARAGADVLVHAGRNRSAGERLTEEISRQGRQTTLVMANLADVSGCSALVRRAVEWAGAIDIWVNNAGVDILTGSAAGWSFDEKLDALWKVDVQATLRLSRAIGHHMRQHGRGVILNVGWDQAEHGMEGDSGELFATVKGAVMAFSKSLARSLAPQVRVNCLAPGWIRTAWGENASEPWQERACRESQLGRWGTPEDVARVACFLASPAASFITGQVVPVNGGFRIA